MVCWASQVVLRYAAPLERSYQLLFAISICECQTFRAVVCNAWRKSYLEGHHCAPDIPKHIRMEADVPLKDVQVALMENAAFDCAAKVVQNSLRNHWFLTKLFEE